MAKTKITKVAQARRGQSKPKRRVKSYRTTQVMVRVTMDEKKLMVRGAAHDGDSLSTWLRRFALRRVKQLKLTGR